MGYGLWAVGCGLWAVGRLLNNITDKTDFYKI